MSQSGATLIHEDSPVIDGGKTTSEEQAAIADIAKEILERISAEEKVEGFAAPETMSDEWKMIEARYSELQRLRIVFCKKAREELSALLENKESDLLAKMKKLKAGVASIKKEMALSDGATLSIFLRDKVRINILAGYLQELHFDRSPFNPQDNPHIEDELKSESGPLKIAVESLEIENVAVKDLPELFEKMKSLNQRTGTVVGKFLNYYLTTESDIQKVYKQPDQESDPQVAEFCKEFFYSERSKKPCVFMRYWETVGDYTSENYPEGKMQRAKRVRTEFAKISHIYGLFNCALQAKGTAGSEAVLAIAITACKKYKLKDFQSISDFDKENIYSVLRDKKVSRKLKEALFQVMVPSVELAHSMDPAAQYIVSLSKIVLEYYQAGEEDTMNSAVAELMVIIHSAYVDYKGKSFDEGKLTEKLIALTDNKEKDHHSIANSAGRFVNFWDKDKRNKDLPDLVSLLLTYLMRQKNKTLYLAIFVKKNLHKKIMGMFSKIDAEQKGEVSVASKAKGPKESKDQAVTQAAILKANLIAAYLAFRSDRTLAVLLTQPQTAVASAATTTRGQATPDEQKNSLAQTPVHEAVAQTKEQLVRRSFSVGGSDASADFPVHTRTPSAATKGAEPLAKTGLQALKAGASREKTGEFDEAKAKTHAARQDRSDPAQQIPAVYSPVVIV